MEDIATENVGEHDLTPRIKYIMVSALCSLSVCLKVCTKGTEGTLDVIMISYIILVAGLLHYFLLDHAYK